MSITRVLVDANVLYSKTLRDWLGIIYCCSDGGLYYVYWTEDIVAEALYRLRRKYPQWNGRRITAIRDAITRTFEDGRVDDFVVDDDYPGRDIHDKHVHAAALACAADVLLSCDKDFVTGNVDLDHMPYDVFTPDEFFVLADDSAPHWIAAATRDQTDYRRARGERADLAARLQTAGCPVFAERVRRHQSRLSF